MTFKVILFKFGADNNTDLNLVLKPFAKEKNGYLPMYMRELFKEPLSNGVTIEKSRVEKSHNSTRRINTENFYTPMYCTNMAIFYGMQKQIELLHALHDDNDDFVLGIADARLFSLRAISNLKGMIKNMGGVLEGETDFKVNKTPLSKVNGFNDEISFTQWLNDRLHSDNQPPVKTSEILLLENSEEAEPDINDEISGTPPSEEQKAALIAKFAGKKPSKSALDSKKALMQQKEVVEEVLEETEEEPPVDEKPKRGRKKAVKKENVVEETEEKSVTPVKPKRVAKKVVTTEVTIESKPVKKAVKPKKATS